MRLGPIRGGRHSVGRTSMNEISKDYDDSYSGCLRTYATLRIYPGDVHPQEVTTRLNIAPSKFWVRDEALAANPAQKASAGAKAMHGWFLTTHGRLDSKDTRRHIDMLLAPLLTVAGEVEGLQQQGAVMDIICFWHAAPQQGGPALAPRQLQALAQLNIAIAWNIFVG
jgi:hypothetical protein